MGWINVIFAVGVGAMILGCTTSSERLKKGLASDAERFSYAVGNDIGNSLKDFKSELDLDALLMGLDDTLKDREAQLTAAEVRKIKAKVFEKVRAQQAKADKAEGEKNKAEGIAFLKANKSKEGVQTTSSGLQYKVIKAGDGAKPKLTDTVTVHYRGTLIDGTEFDSSYKRNQPATFPVNGVISGWTEALQLMAVGSKYELYIPSSLAYGERGAGQDIGPNATLIFEVELLSIQ